MQAVGSRKRRGRRRRRTRWGEEPERNAKDVGVGVDANSRLLFHLDPLLLEQGVRGEEEGGREGERKRHWGEGQREGWT